MVQRNGTIRSLCSSWTAAFTAASLLTSFLVAPAAEPGSRLGAIVDRLIPSILAGGEHSTNQCAIRWQSHPRVRNEREGDAGPVRRCLAAEASPAALLSSLPLPPRSHGDVVGDFLESHGVRRHGGIFPREPVRNQFHAGRPVDRVRAHRKRRQDQVIAVIDHHAVLAGRGVPGSCSRRPPAAPPAIGGGIARGLRPARRRSRRRPRPCRAPGRGRTASRLRPREWAASPRACNSGAGNRETCRPESSPHARPSNRSDASRQGTTCAPTGPPRHRTDRSTRAGPSLLVRRVVGVQQRVGGPGHRERPVPPGEVPLGVRPIERRRVRRHHARVAGIALAGPHHAAAEQGQHARNQGDGTDSHTDSSSDHGNCLLQDKDNRSTKYNAIHMASSASAFRLSASPPFPLTLQSPSFFSSRAPAHFFPPPRRVT